MSKQEVVAIAYSVIAADATVAYLDSCGIEAWAPGLNTSSMQFAHTWIMFRDKKIWVDSVDALKARQSLLESPVMAHSVEILSAQVDTTPQNCPQCHSARIRSGRLPWPVMLILILLLVGIPLMGSMNKDWTCKDCGHHWHVG